MKDSFENIITSSKRKPNLIEIDRGKEFLNKISQNFLKKNNNEIYCRNTTLGAIFAEIFDRTMRDLLEKLAFEQGDGNWIDILPTIAKQIKNRVQSFTKLNSLKGNLKKK